MIICGTGKIGYCTWKATLKACFEENLNWDVCVRHFKRVLLESKKKKLRLFSFSKGLIFKKNKKVFLWSYEEIK